jgi:competence protein ComEA
MAMMVVAVAVGLGWWMLSAFGSGGSAMDPDLPFAVEAGSVAGDGTAGEPRGDPVAGSANGNPGSETSPGSADPAGSRTPAGEGADTGGVMVVHMAGAVAVPGVHSVPVGARVHDAVVAAGGARHDADLDRLNLAAPLVDGSRVYVPMIGELAPPPLVGDGSTPVIAGGQMIPGPTGSGPVAGGGAALSLSTASSAELQSLPGVGPSTAEAIIAHRDANGPFTTVDQLLDVRGIGPAKLSAIRDLVAP